MSQQKWRPIDYFTSVEANKILQTVLKWSQNETEVLQESVQADFDKVITAIQQSSVIWKILAEKVLDQEEKVLQLTVQEILKIRKAVLSVLGPGEDKGQENDDNELHASPELARIGSIIQGLFINWTYFSNTKLLAMSIHDFCEEWVKKILTEPGELNSADITLKTKKFSMDDDDDDFWDDDEVSPGDASVIKIIPDIILAYVYSLDKHSWTELPQVLKDELESCRWQHMTSIVADMKRLLLNTKLSQKLKNSIQYSFDPDTRKKIAKLDSYLPFLPKK